MGVISGVVTWSDGSKATGVRVTASVSGLFSGGMTETVYTDRDGRFVLEWSSDSSLDTVYVNGTTAERNVRSGSKVHLVAR